VVPVNNNYLRKVLSKEESEEIIDMISDVNVINVNDKMIEN